ncbi:MAG: SDR family oxidoreductase [Acidimicrobiales bacterium]
MSTSQTFASSPSDEAADSPGTVLIVGATSAIAEAAARIYAERGSSLLLLARDEERLDDIAADLRVRGAAQVSTQRFDADDTDEHEKLIDAAYNVTGRVDVALVAFGTLPDQERSERNVFEALDHIHTNAVATTSILLHLANRFEQQRSGTLAVITSVAGDRGRRSNYLYGASKKMVSVVLDGLRYRLREAGVTVIDVRPGFVDTPMTAEFDKGALWAKPEAVAKRIVAATDDGDEQVYTPAFWRPIMLVVRSLPKAVMQRLPL